MPIQAYQQRPGRRGAFDTTTVGPAAELAPDPAANRYAATIGGNTVAWMDFGYSPGSPATYEIVAYDLGTSVATRVTTDTRNDRWVAASPTGSVLAWESCDSSGLASV